jgi:hypothetical protein
MFADVQTVSTIIAATAVTVTAVFGLLQLRNYRRHLKNMEAAMNIQTIIRLYEIWTNQNVDRDRELMKKCAVNSYEEWRQRYSNAEEGKAMQRVGRLYETFALLARKETIDSNLLIEILEDALIEDWAFMKPIIYGLREEFHNPSIGRNMEWMVNLAEKLKATKRGHS